MSRKLSKAAQVIHKLQTGYNTPEEMEEARQKQNGIDFFQKGKTYAHLVEMKDLLSSKMKDLMIIHPKSLPTTRANDKGEE